MKQEGLDEESPGGDVRVLEEGSLVLPPRDDARVAESRALSADAEPQRSRRRFITAALLLVMVLVSMEILALVN